MKKIGLALSGGGFRATLYHLGLARLLRDAGLLGKVTHITSVSGGSIFAAHLALNWDRYNGPAADFDAAAAELLRFVRMDARNRILRRYPLLFPVRGARRLLGLPNRKLTRTGLLEVHYEKYLYGDTSLFELPARPALHILATNLSEGCLCSFSRNGLLMMRRQSGDLRTQRVQVGLATVPMAVAASSAFPGFFPPLELTGADVGAGDGEFGRHAYTDGGVFDNLGVRMFRYLERPLLAESPLSRHDFLDLPGLVAAFRHAAEGRDETPLRRLAQILVASSRRAGPLLAVKPDGATPVAGGPPPVGAGDGRADVDDLLAASLDHVLRHHPLQSEPPFAGLPLAGADVEALRRRDAAPGASPLGPDDQLWLNRQLLEAAVRQTTGRGCFRRARGYLDGVLVSDVGKPFEVQNDRRAGGLISTAMRSSDILMDRVWQLENEAFGEAPGFVFARMTDVVEPDEDPTAPHPELQRQAARVRTDLDRFSPLEISALVRHGYCVGRKACRDHPELFGGEAPAGPPWDPTAAGAVTVSAPPPAKPVMAGATAGPAPATAEPAARTPSPVTADARALQASSLRRIWGSLFDYRDWVSYVYVPILVPMLLLTPYAVVRHFQRSYQMNTLMESISQGSPDLRVIGRLLDGPVTPWVGEPAEEVADLGPRQFAGFEVLQDSRVIDLRAWSPARADAPDSLVYGYRRLKVRKTGAGPDDETFRIGLLTTHPQTRVRFPPQDFRPRLRVMKADALSQFEAVLDVRKVPPGETFDLTYEHLSPGNFIRSDDEATVVPLKIEADTAEVTRWFFMPAGKEYTAYRLYQLDPARPARPELIRPVTEYLATDSTLIGYKLLLIKGPVAHEIQWSYR